MHRRFFNTITYPYWVPRLERLLRMFGQTFGKLHGKEVFKALSDFGTFVQHTTKKLSSISSPILLVDLLVMSSSSLYCIFPLILGCRMQPCQCFVLLWVFHCLFNGLPTTLGTWDIFDLDALIAYVV